MAQSEGAAAADDRSLSTALHEVLRKVETVDTALHDHKTLNCWQDVADAIERAREVDSNKAKKSPLRAGFRKAKPEIVLLESLTAMIPDETGLSVLRGGLTTLCKMAILRLELRETILNAFEDIPETFLRAVEAFSRFPDALDLLQAVQNLYRILLVKVETLINILIRSHPHKNIVVRLWRQLPGREVDVVRQCLEEVSRAAKRVTECSKAALERTVGNIDRKAEESLVVNHAILAAMQQATIEKKDLRADLETVVRDAVEDSLNRLISAHKREIAGRPQNVQLSLFVPQPVPHTTFLALPSPALSTSPFTPPAQLISYAHPLPSPPMIPSPRTIHDLLDALDVPDGTPASVLADVLGRSSNIRPDAASRGGYLLTMMRFQEWLRAPLWQSDLILADGHCGDVTINRISPMSLFCARLSEALQRFQAPSPPRQNDFLYYPPHHQQPQHQQIIVLHHFCGQHTSYRDPLRGPSGLMRNLIHQLLVQGFLNNSTTAPSQATLGFILEQFLASLHSNPDDIPTLCRLFTALVNHLPTASSPTSAPAVIFCLIDGISDLETVLDGWRDDVCDIVEMLLSLVLTTANTTTHRSRSPGPSPGPNNNASPNTTTTAEDPFLSPSLIPTTTIPPALRVLLTSAERSTELAEWVVPPDRHVSLRAGHLGGDAVRCAGAFAREVTGRLGGGDVYEDGEEGGEE